MQNAGDTEIYEPEGERGREKKGETEDKAARWRERREERYVDADGGRVR